MFSNVFNYDNPFWRFMGKLGDLIILNILWVICSIPIVTIGASTTAVYYVTLKLVKDEEGATIRSFFKSFKENLKQMLVIWVILMIVGIVLLFDLQFVYTIPDLQSGLRTVLIAAFGCLSFFYLSMLTYIFPIQAKFYNPIKQTFANAFFMAARHFPKTLCMVLVDFAIVLLCSILVPKLFIIILIFGMPLLAFVNSYFLTGIFEKYIPVENHQTDGNA